MWQKNAVLFRIGTILCGGILLIALLIGERAYSRKNMAEVIEKPEKIVSENVGAVCAIWGGAFTIIEGKWVAV